jgi:protein TonB
MTTAIIALWLSLLPPQTTAPTTPQTAAPSQALPVSRPNPDATGRYHVGDGVAIPKVIYQVDPEFTKDAKKQKVTGIALVTLIVGTEGTPTNVHIVRSVADSLGKKHLDRKHVTAAQSLDQAAVEAVKKYKFTPATYHGEPVPVELNVEVNFQIF